MNVAGVRGLWSEAINPFRRALFNTLYLSNELVRAFSGGLPAGRLGLPEMNDWTLGALRQMCACCWKPPAQ